jgi:hypothetical protein
MPNQNDYDRINKCMIAPLCVQYKAKYVDEEVEGFVEELARYDDETLRKAFKKLRRERKQAPSLAHVIEACEAEKPKSRPSSGQPQVRDTISRNDSALADQVMNSPLGQLAIGEGVAYSVWLAAYRDGREITKQSEVYRLKAVKQDTVDRLARMDYRDALFPMLERMHRTLMEKEERIANQYRHQQVA